MLYFDKMSRFENEQLQFVSNRSVTESRKWANYSKSDVLPMGIADMDVRTPSIVLDALKERIDHGVFGYDNVKDSLFNTIIDRLKKHYNWEIDRESIVLLPGVIPSMYATSRCVNNCNTDAVVITPVYGEIVESVQHAGLRLNTLSVQKNNDGQLVGLDKLESIITPNTRLFNLCNPHNPIGHVYTRDELEGISEICKSHNIVVSSDEVYADLILDDKNRHIPIASIDNEIAQRTITHMSASKTFNLSGLRFSYTIIPNQELRNRFILETSRIQQGVNFLGAIATEAAYKNGEPWRQNLIAYLRSNRDLIHNRLSKTQNLSSSKVDATFLEWIDARKLKKDDLYDFFSEELGIEIQDGRNFNTPGFVRLNFGCSREMLNQALDRMDKV